MHVQERSDCANCGAVLAGDARFCQRCGAPVALMTGHAEDGDDPADAVEPVLSPVRVWGPRVGAALLLLGTAAVAFFALLALMFDVFVE